MILDHGLIIFGELRLVLSCESLPAFTTSLIRILERASVLILHIMYFLSLHCVSRAWRAHKSMPFILQLSSNPVDLLYSKMLALSLNFTGESLVGKESMCPDLEAKNHLKMWV